MAILGDTSVTSLKVLNGSPMCALGACSTAAATAAKVVTIDDPTWTLKVGDVIGVKYTYSNTASSVTLNVNGSGAKSIWYNTAAYTSTSAMITGYANRYIYYMYDGTYWVWLSHGYDNNDNTYTSAYCSTAAGTAAKTASQTNYILTANTYTYINIVNANTSASALTLNINGKGAKPIYINGSASSTSNYTLPAGTYLIFYNGTNYYFRTDGASTVGTSAISTSDITTWNNKEDSSNKSSSYTASSTTTFPNTKALVDGLNLKLDKTSVKTSNTSSATDVYSCNYINNLDKLKYYTELTEDTASLTISDLDLEGDGGIYDLWIQGGVVPATSEEIADVYLRINSDSSNAYYQFGYYCKGTGTTSSVSSHTWTTGYRPTAPHFYFAHNMAKYYSTIKGTFKMDYTYTGKRILYDWEAGYCYSGVQLMSKAWGTYWVEANLTSIYLIPATGSFRKGTRFYIWKR